MNIGRKSIQFRIVALVLATAVVAIVGNIISLTAFNFAVGKFRDVLDVDVATITQLTNLMSATKDISRQMIRLGWNNDPKEFEKVAARHQDALKVAKTGLDGYLSRCKLAGDSDKAMVELRSRIEKGYGEFEALSSKILEHARGHNDVTAILNGDFRASYNVLFAAIDEATELYRKNMETHRIATNRAVTVSTWLILLVTLLGSGLALSVGAYLGGGFQKFLLSEAEDLVSAATVMTAAANMVTNSSHVFSEATTEQAASVQETASAAEEIRAMAAKNGDNTKAAEKQLSGAVHHADIGRQAINDLSEVMKHIAEGTDHVEQDVKKGNAEFEQIIQVINAISEKTKIINDIVFQTKLLSFNASVEAARAGEHGKGFAVVAEEVGKLAAMSGQAAQEISEVLEQNVARVSDIVKNNQKTISASVAASKAGVVQGMEKTGKCLEVFKEVSALVSDANRLVTEIASASAEQAAGTAEIAKSVEQLNAATQMSMATSQQVAGEASDLTKQIEHLVHLADQLAWSVLGEDRHKKADKKYLDVINGALSAHAEWKNRLKRVVGKTSTEALDPAKVELDNQCALGKWIYSDGEKRMGRTALFKRLREDHAVFHRCAGSILRVAQQGDTGKGREMLADGCDFTTHSKTVIGQLVRMKFMA